MREVRSWLRAGNERLYEKSQVRLFRLILESMRLTPSSKAPVQLVRSFIVSIIAFIFDFGLMLIMKETLGMNYLIAATLSYCVGLIVNYFLSILWVFADRKMARRHIEFSFFAIISLVGLAINGGIIAGLVQLLQIDYRLAKIVATVVVFFWNFIVRKKYLY